MMRHLTPITAFMLVAAVTLPVAYGAGAATGPRTSHATLTAPGGATVATASSLCAPSFNYLIVGVLVPLPAGGTVYLQPTPGAPKQLVAQSSGPALYLIGFPATCPPAGGVLSLVNNATQQQLGQGTLAPYTPM